MRPLTKNNLNVFLVSFVMLFVELVLIRWISTEIRIFAYFNNLVLLSCFLGMGLGCYFSKKPSALVAAPLLLALLVSLLAFPVCIRVDNRSIHLFKDIPLLLSAFEDSVIWYNITAKITLFMVAVGMASVFYIFFILLFIFYPMGQILGRALDEHHNTIAAYSLNVVSSIAGGWLFSFLSFLYTPPQIWFLLASIGIGLLVVMHRVGKLSLVVSLVALVWLNIVAFSHEDGRGGETRVVWSPYQKLELRGGNLLEVNNVGYMSLKNLSDEYLRGFPEMYPVRKLNQYDMPFLLRKGAQDVLILGAGAGNDVAGALRNNVKSVDAVEIDPGIYRLGLEFHPERPYSDKRVNVIIDDARAHLRRTAKTYDVVSIGLLDAHTLSSTYNNMRLDHYVYTEESFREVKNLLRDGGVFTVIFEVEREWIGERLYGLLQKVFGHPPIAFSVRSPNGVLGWGGIMFATGTDMNRIANTIRADTLLEKFIRNNRVTSSHPSIKLTSDNWPYLYLRKPEIPAMHLCVIAVLVGLFAVAGRFLFFGGDKRGGVDLHFLFLGAAFLLLEFQNISRTTLLFGATWQVNTITITAILALVLCANLYVHFHRTPSLTVFYALLLVSVMAVYLVPLRAFNVLDYQQKCVLVSLFTNLPIFFAGVIFIRSFNACGRKDVALGSNFLGSFLGGVLESLSFILGTQALLLLVAVFYLLSLAAMVKGIPRRLRAAEA